MESLGKKFKEQLYYLAQFIAKDKYVQYSGAMACRRIHLRRILNVCVQFGVILYEVCYYKLKNTESGWPYSKTVQYIEDEEVFESKFDNGQFTFGITELQVPWDLGGYLASAWGQAEFQEGENATNSSIYCMVWAGWWAMVGVGRVQLTRQGNQVGQEYKYSSLSQIKGIKELNGKRH